MKWEDYYDRFWDWAESTKISRISSLTDFTSSAEVVEIANEFFDEKIGSCLVKRALDQGLRFSPSEIIELGSCVTDDVFCEAIRNRQGRFTTEQYAELEGLCCDEDLLDAIARKDGIRREMDDLPFQPQIAVMQPVRKGPGFFAALLGLTSNTGSAPRHPGRCTGDCAHCPAHYGYRYGRWYYGHHHTHGCEFGGNDGSGKP